MVYNGKPENPIKMDDLGVPLFLETPIYQSQHSGEFAPRRHTTGNHQEVLITKYCTPYTLGRLAWNLYKNHQIGKEHHLPKPPFSGSMLIFQGAATVTGLRNPLIDWVHEIKIHTP